MRVSTFFAFYLVVFTGCGYKGVYPCSDSSFRTYFLQFSDGEIDTMILRKYKPNDSYQQLVESVVLTRSNTLYERRGDTVRIYTADSIGIKARFDWQIEIPAMGRTVNISEIVSSEEEFKCPSLARDCGCFNTVHSVRVDNVLLTNLGTYPGDHALYIRR